jgi:hypothetical protein
MIPHSATVSELRYRRAAALVSTVRAVPGGFRVSSASRNEDYLVSQPCLPTGRPNGHPICTCPDYQRHGEDPEYRCKHQLAVEMALEEGRVPEVANGLPAAEPATPALPGGLHVLHRYLPSEDPVRVKLIRNTKGYSWEIAVAERDPETALAVLQDLEQRVRTCFGEPPDPQ